MIFNKPLLQKHGLVFQLNNKTSGPRAQAHAHFQILGTADIDYCQYKEAGGRKNEAGGRRKEEGSRKKKEEGRGRKKEEGGRRRKEEGGRHNSPTPARWQRLERKGPERGRQRRRRRRKMRMEEEEEEEEGGGRG